MLNFNHKKEGIQLKHHVVFLLAFFATFCRTLSADSSELDRYNLVLYNDETVAKMITVITATSPVLSIPNTTHIFPAQVSLHRIPALAKAKKIIVFDGIPPGQEHLQYAYEQYKQNIRKLTQSDHYFTNTKLVFCSQWGHLSGAIEEAMKHVTTPYVFMHQHDLVILKPFDLNGIIATMDENPAIKYVHFWGGKNKSSKWWNRRLDEKVEGTHYVPLTRSFGWSDQCHVASAAYYKDFVLPQCDHCFMENAMQRKFKKKFDKIGKKSHEEFGTYLYGELSDGHYIKHTDGRNSP